MKRSLTILDYLIESHQKNIVDITEMVSDWNKDGITLGGSIILIHENIVKSLEFLKSAMLEDIKNS